MLQLGDDTLVATEFRDVLVAKFSYLTSEPIWARSYGGVADDEQDWDEGTSITTDSLGNVYFSGFSRGNIDFGGGLRCEGQTRSVFLVKLDGAGNHLFSRCFGGMDTYVERHTSIATDGDGNVYLLGSSDDPIDLGTGMLPPEDGPILLAKLASSGQTLWASPWTGARPYSLSVGAGGEIYLAGDAAESFELAGDSTGNHGAFLTKLDTSGGACLAPRIVALLRKPNGPCHHDDPRRSRAGDQRSVPAHRYHRRICGLARCGRRLRSGWQPALDLQ